MSKLGYLAPKHLCVCAALAVGEAFGLMLSAGSHYWSLVAYLTVSITLLAFGYASRTLACTAVTLLGITLAYLGEQPRRRVLECAELESGPLVVEASIEGAISCKAKWISFEMTYEGIPLRIVFEGDCKPQPGERWRCAGWLERKDISWRGRRTLWVRGRGTFARKVSTARPSLISRCLDSARHRLVMASAIGLSHAPLAAVLNRAILFGERGTMPRWVRQMFADAGTAHIFAISGLHVGILAALFAHLFGAVFFPRRWLIIPLAPVLWLYVAMIGAPASAVRAASMATIYYLAPAFLRRSDALVAWSITFLVFHLLRPAMLIEVGSLLSFSVVLGIILYLRWAQAFKWHFLSGSVAVSCAAWVSGGAISAAVFGGISFGGLVANVILIPLASVGVVSGAIGAALGIFWREGAAHLNNVAGLVTQAMVAVSWVTVRVAGTGISANLWPWWYFVAWYAVPILVLYLIQSVVLRRRQIP